MMARRPPRRAAGRPPATRGVAALEFVLALPAMTLLLLGFLSLATALLTRYHLTTAAAAAARSCTAMGTPSQGCAQGEVGRYLQGTFLRRKCGNLLVNAPNPQPIPGTGLRLFTVTVRCAYRDNVAGRFLAADLVNPVQNLVASAAMPVAPP